MFLLLLVSYIIAGIYLFIYLTFQNNKMDLNSIIFPAPIEVRNFEYYSQNKELIFIPKQNKNKLGYIPCLLKQTKKLEFSNKYMIYFHGNAEDIFNSALIINATINNLPVMYLLNNSITLYLLSTRDIVYTLVISQQK